MKYRKYNDIENCLRTKFMDKIYEQGKSGGIWTVTEKVHGANFSIKFDGNDFYCGKRSDWVVGPDNEFFNYLKVLEDNRNRIQHMYVHMRDEMKLDFTDMTLFGELCGGSYPHPNVPKVKSAIRVQDGIHYSPTNEFYVFDMMLDDEYVNYDMVVEALEDYSFLFARPLFTGTLDECLEHSNQFQTLIPEELGHPEIEGNFCEGVVIKPNDARFMGHTRVIIKNKNSKWSEKTKKRKIRTEHKFTEGSQDQLDDLITFVTENRLKNVLSKEGKIEQNMFGYVMKKFTEDIMKDFIKDNESYNKLEKTERKLIQKRMAFEASNMLRENFLNILDEIF